MFQAGGVGMILYNANDGQSQVTDTHWVPSVHINNTDGLVIKAYIADTRRRRWHRSVVGEMTTVERRRWRLLVARSQPLVGGHRSSRTSRARAADPGRLLAVPGSGTGPGELFAGDCRNVDVEPAHGRRVCPDQAGASRLEPGDGQVGDHDDGLPGRRDRKTAYSRPIRSDMGAGHVDPAQASTRARLPAGSRLRRWALRVRRVHLRRRLRRLHAGSCDFLGVDRGPDGPERPELPSIGIADMAGSQTVSAP